MLAALLSLAAAAAMLCNLALATNFTVGGPTGGWDTSTNLQAWASSQIFSVGDNLVFQYTPNHNVFEVSKADYNSCQNSNPILMSSGGITSIPLLSPGKRYFICGTIGHCSQGQKLEINTLAAASTLSPASPPDTPISPPIFPVNTPASSPVADMRKSQPPESDGRTSLSTFPPTSFITPGGFSSPPPPFSSAAAKVKAMNMGFTFVMMVLLLV